MCLWAAFFVFKSQFFATLSRLVVRVEGGTK